MAQLSIPDNSVHRSASTISVAASDTTYHSVHDLDLYRPSSPRGALQMRPATGKANAFDPTLMRRQDSGYESIPSGSKSAGSHGSGRRASTASSQSSQAKPRTRPSIRRASQSTPNQPHSRVSGYSLNRTRSHQQASGYYHFPSPDGSLGGDDEESGDTVGGLYPPPPQTTHYWTSDRTRRLEYAAIDAAGRGVKGWVMKHVVPECFVPKETRRLAFDDDTGSVRRYRLELECDDSAEKERRNKKKGWLFRR